MPEPSAIDPELRKWATPRQLEFIDAIEAAGGIRAGALRLGVHHSTVQDSMRNLKRIAAKGGYSPDHDMKRPVPDGFLVKGVSTYYDKDGNAAGQWVKSSIDAERQQEIFRAAAAAMAEELPRLAPVAKPLAETAKDLLNLYIFTDCHVGMKAWHKEGGHDWDLNIVERVLTAAFRAMIASAPAAKYGFLGQLGDFLHFDSLTAVTPAHGHILDADSRFGKVVAVAVRILRTIVDEALRRHETVIVLLAEGNHDPASAVWLRIMFKALYENEPRVVVIDSELPYYVHQHGNVMLGFHHGHLSKKTELPLIFAAQYPAIWGATSKRYIHTGHQHHKDAKEYAGAEVIQHPTLAARDAYAARGGWISERDATAITYHCTYGEVGRVTITPEMLAA